MTEAPREDRRAEESAARLHAGPAERRAQSVHVSVSQHTLAVAVATVSLGDASERLFDVLATTGPGGLTADGAGNSLAHGGLLSTSVMWVR